MLLAQDQEDLQYMTRKLNEECEKAGLLMNLENNKYLCSTDDSDDLELKKGEII